MRISKAFVALLAAAFLAAALAERREPRPLAPPGFFEAEIAGVVGDQLGIHQTVLLVRRDDLRAEEVPDRVLPITVGGTEGTSIALAAAGKSYPRPLTHDLLAQVVARLGARVTGVFIHSIQDETFYARLDISGPDGKLSFDCRPSDGLALAMRSGAPIWISEKVFNEAAITLPPRHPAFREEEEGARARGA